MKKTILTGKTHSHKCFSVGKTSVTAAILASLHRTLSDMVQTWETNCSHETYSWPCRCLCLNSKNNQLKKIQAKNNALGFPASAGDNNNVWSSKTYVAPNRSPTIQYMVPPSSSVLGRDMPAGLNLTNMIHGMIHIKISGCIEETIKMILLVWNL